MKDYKNVLEGVVNIINTAETSDIGFANICTYIGENCPELQESQDEKIRKALINVFATHKDYEMFFGVSVEDIIAWLESIKNRFVKQSNWKPSEGQMEAMENLIINITNNPLLLDNYTQSNIRSLCNDLRKLV